MTNWSRVQKNFVIDDSGKEIPADVYWRKKRLGNLPTAAQHLLLWIKQRKKQSKVITLVELTKCLTPPCLRKSAVIRRLMSELVAAGCAEIVTQHIYYSGRWRREAWRILELRW